ncbi:MAG: Gldg family protein [Deltaproteobacteria bacterium]|nr:Gldg family protein [Deltaproteobacteria bacterium]
MNVKLQKTGKFVKFALYAVVVILINAAAVSLFFRADLTKNRIYSLSPASKAAVATLREPMTAKVFFTKDLPAPHNNTETYLRDLLNEYALHNRKYFKVHYYDVSADTEGVSDKARANQQTAREYGISPVQVQNVEHDELKFKQAYMGMALIHGDVIEQMSAITTTEGLEYKLTTAIQRLNRKVSALLKLDGKVKVRVFLSASFSKVGPFMGLNEIDSYPDQIRALVERMNGKTYNRLEFDLVDPILQPAAVANADVLKTMRFSWPDLPPAKIQAGTGFIGMLMQYKDETAVIPLMRVVRMPIFGEQYQLIGMDQLEETINANLERMLGINQDIGYLADFGTLDVRGGGYFGPERETVTRFTELLNSTYAVKNILLKDNPIPNGLKSLIIAGPRDKFSDYALYQIDQALMSGTNLALFLDRLEEQRDNQAGMGGNQQMKFHVPLNTGLEKMLEHYGVRIRPSLVLDERCYRQRLPPQQGGGEQPIYFIPMIESANINKELDYMKNIKGLFAFACSPLELNAEGIAAQKLTPHELFSSSRQSWEMGENIILHPMYIAPPAAGTERAKRPLAYMLEGTFTSYFKGKPMPEKPVADAGKESAKTKGSPALAGADRPQFVGQGAFRETSVPAKIFIVASSRMIGDQIMDETGQNPNAAFALNIIDVLNDRNEVAVMRSKVQHFNPLHPAGASAKFWIKTANIVGLPVLVIVAGFIVWGFRQIRKKKIQMMFQKTWQADDSSNEPNRLSNQ